MAGTARNITVAGENFVVEQQLSDLGARRRKAMIILVGQRLWIGRSPGRRRHHQKQQTCQMMKYSSSLTAPAIALLLLVCAGIASPAARAEIEHARDLMEANRFEEAMAELWPAARSGNADAEELIGVMYAMGLGVEQDHRRAFEWYMRSSMKGHPGAQSGVGWYYELGLGMPAPDLVRAYMWYVLSAIGGDPDAAISQEEVIKKMTPKQIKDAHELIDDYRIWLYPFR